MCVNGSRNSQFRKINLKAKIKGKTTEGIFFVWHGKKGVDGSWWNVWNHLLSNIYGTRHISLFNNNREIVDVVAVAGDDHHHIFCVYGWMDGWMGVCVWEFIECQTRAKGGNLFNENAWSLFKWWTKIVCVSITFIYLFVEKRKKMSERNQGKQLVVSHSLYG